MKEQATASCATAKTPPAKPRNTKPMSKPGTKPGCVGRNCSRRIDMTAKNYLSFLLFVAAVAAARADDTAATAPKYHAGSRVIVIHETPLRVDDHPVKQLDPGTALLVEEIKDGFLGVTSGRQGWVDETDVVPVEKSIGPLTDLLAHDADNVELHELRADVADELKDYDTMVADYTA